MSTDFSKLSRVLQRHPERVQEKAETMPSVSQFCALMAMCTILLQFIHPSKGIENFS